MSGRCTDSYCDNMNLDHRCNDREVAPSYQNPLSQYSSKELEMALKKALVREKQEEDLRKQSAEKLRHKRIKELKEELSKLEQQS